MDKCPETKSMAGGQRSQCQDHHNTDVPKQATNAKDIIGFEVMRGTRMRIWTDSSRTLETCHSYDCVSDNSALTQFWNLSINLEKHFTVYWKCLVVKLVSVSVWHLTVSPVRFYFFKLNIVLNWRWFSCGIVYGLSQVQTLIIHTLYCFDNYCSELCRIYPFAS